MVQEEINTHFPDDDSISDVKIHRSRGELNDTDISSLGSDKWYNLDHFAPMTKNSKSERPSTTSSLRSRSDRRTTKFDKNKGDVQNGT